MKRTASAIFLLVLCATLAVAGTETITHEAMFLMKRVGSPALSPDGKWVAVPVTVPSYDGEKQTSDLWLVPADGSGEPRQLTFSKAGEGDLAWSPDSRKIAFTAKREGDEQNQIYVLDLAGGEAMRVTTVALAARAPQWSPDGSKLLFLSGSWPEATDPESNEKAAKERKDRKSKVRAYDGFPIRNWDRWLDESETRLYVVAPERDAKAKDLLAGSKLLATPGFSGAGAPAWTPDGASIVFAASTNRDVAAYDAPNSHLFEVSAAGGEPRQLTSGTADHGDPKFRPGASEICFSYAEEYRKIYALGRIACAPWPWKDEKRVLTAGSDRSVGDWEFTPDGKTVWFTAEDAGLVKLYTVAASGGKVAPAFESKRGVYSGLSIEGDAKRPVIVANWGSSTNPNEVVRIDAAAGTHRPLTRFAAEDAAKLSWQAPEHFWFTNQEGMRIHSMLFYPPNFDPSKKYPLLVLMHGGAHNMWQDAISLRWNYHLLSAPGYVLVATNYRGSTGFGEEFALKILGDPLRGPARDINDGADEAIRRYSFIDGTRQAAAGASYGGHLANWMEGNTTRYDAIVSHAGLATLAGQWGTSDTIFHRELMVGTPPWEGNPLWQDQSPLTYAKNFSTPMLISVGENDYRVPMNNTIEMWSALQRQRVPSRLLIWPDENHWIQKGENSRVFYQEVHTWLEKWVK